MRTIETVATIAEDGTLSAKAPPDIPPGTHKVVIVIDEVVVDHEPRLPLDLPEFHVGPWPEGLSLRREDMYDDWGR